MLYDLKPSSGLKVRPIKVDSRIFDLKTHDGKSLGHIIDGEVGGPVLIVGGTGMLVRSAFQQVLLNPIFQAFKGRLVLLLLDKVDDQDSAEVLRDVTIAVGAVSDVLFLPSAEIVEEQAELAVQTIERFCIRHGGLPHSEIKLDCASI